MPPCLSSEPVVCLGARGLGKEKRVLKRFVANTLRCLLLKKSSKHYFQKSLVIAQDQWNTWIHDNEHMFYQAGSSTIAGYKSNLTFHFLLQLTIALEPTCIVIVVNWSDFFEAVSFLIFSSSESLFPSLSQQGPMRLWLHWQEVSLCLSFRVYRRKLRGR